MVTSIFALAFPMLIGILQHIDKKYNVRLIKKFVSEWQTWVFLGLLVLSVGWYMVLPLISSQCIMELFPWVCVLLVISLLSVIYLIYIYSVPSSLFNHLLESYPDEPDEQKLWFSWLAAILETNVVDDLQGLYYKISEWYKKAETKSAEISLELLNNGIIMLNEALCKQERSRFFTDDGTCLLSIFFDNTVEINNTVGITNCRLLSDETLRTLWICLHQQLDYNRDDWFMDYWKHAHQYYDARFVSDNPCDDEKTKKEIEKAKKDFMEFHLALGGLLLYKEKYNLLKQVTNYSSDVPARYLLVPEILKELITSFTALFSNAPDEYNKYVLKYPFLNLNSGIADDNAFINSWIQKYLVFLLYRHFTGQYAHPNADEEQPFRVPEDESSWRALSPILWKRMNDSELQTISAQILGISEEEMTEAKQYFQDEIDRINKTVAQQP